MHIYYRLSDKNRRGKAPSYFTNENCLNNFLKYFEIDSHDSITIIADNIEKNTEKWLSTYNIPIILTTLGNSGSFYYCLNEAIKNKKDNEIIYFVENDYLHRKNSKDVMVEAFNTFKADYVSLYDAPEKYAFHYNSNYNKYLDLSGGLFENYMNKIYCGRNCYFRTSNSFTMTFASTVINLKNDIDIFEYNLFNHGSKRESFLSIPRDFELFKMISEVRNRKLLTPMPGYCTHGDLLSPHINWDQYI